jgi:F0F1-type ATP synthase assembly protein I
MVAQWEWAILLLLVLGLLIAELLSVRRSIRRAKQDKAPDNAGR